MSASGAIALWLLGNLFLVGVYDIIVVAYYPHWGTVSRTVYEWSRQWPLLPAAVGGLFIHLFGLGPHQPLE